MTVAREIQLLRKALLTILSGNGLPVSRLHERTVQRAADNHDLEMLHAFVNHADKDTSVTLIRDVLTVQRKLGVPYENEVAARNIAACAKIRKMLPSSKSYEATMDVFAIVIARPMTTPAVINIIERNGLTDANRILNQIRLLVSDERV